VVVIGRDDAEPDPGQLVVLEVPAYHRLPDLESHIPFRSAQ
jgi:hypothetical protein